MRNLMMELFIDITTNEDDRDIPLILRLPLQSLLSHICSSAHLHLS